MPFRILKVFLSTEVGFYRQNNALSLKDNEFDFFHVNGKQGIRNDIDTLFAEDERFSKINGSSPLVRGLKFPGKSMFFHGCVRITPREEVKSE